jgi:hypothetical protein
MNLAAMAGRALVIFVEKLWSRGPLLSTVVGVAFLVLAVLAVPGRAAARVAGTGSRDGRHVNRCGKLEGTGRLAIRVLGGRPQSARRWLNEQPQW